MCQNNCNYCAFRAGRDLRRAHLTPDELARSFDLMYRAGVVESLFLSSGVIGTVKTMDEMLATTELVRLKYGFRGYIHLSCCPALRMRTSPAPSNWPTASRSTWRGRPPNGWPRSRRRNGWMNWSARCGWRPG